MLPVVVEQIHPALTYRLRHEVLWPDKPREYVQLPDDAQGLHYGAWAEGRLVGVVSLFPAPAGGPARFRKFAVEAARQGQSVGTQLMQHLLAEARRLGAAGLWCDARLAAAAFYERFGLAPEGPVFYKGEVPYARFGVAF